MRFAFKLLVVATVAAEQSWWDWAFGTDPEEVSKDLEHKANDHIKHDEYES